MWIRDEDFIRGQVPMTKFHQRILTIGTLEIEEGDVFLDIGSGTGSISIEAALHGAQVHAIDINEEAVDLNKKNAEKFGVELKTYLGSAPEALPDIELDKVFVGGSKGNLVEIFEYISRNLKSGGILLGNFITLKNLEEFRSLLNSHGFKNIETNIVQVSTEDRIGLMRGQNPIFMVKGEKE